MRVGHLISTVACAGMVFSAQIASAQTWETVNVFGSYPGYMAWARAVAVDPWGNILVGGQAADGSAYHALLERSSDGGATWSTIDDFAVPIETINAIGFDAAQNIYTVGCGVAGGGQLFVRKSADAGATWTTLLQTNYGGWVVPGGPGFASDHQGRLYVEGGANPAVVWRSSDGGATWTSSKPFTDSSWAAGILCTPAGVFVIGNTGTAPLGFVRKSTDGGKTWATVDDYTASGVSGKLQAICADSQGNLYTGGFANITTGTGKKAVTTYNWIIRKGTNGGTRWTTLAIVPISGFSAGNVSSLTFDALGNMYAAGWLEPSLVSGPGNWTVLKSADGGVTWQVSDLFRFSAEGNINAAWSLAADAFGNLYAAGTATGNGSPWQWVVRNQLAP